ncbi:HNH endonuclease [Patescibacteria group bacterium]|nr:HNH endonuclease [Patescibacteria group bacterium]
MPRRKDFNGINSPRWNPDAWYVMKGYKYIKAPKGHPHAIHRAGKHRNAWYIAEHRLVMEQKIERYLLPTEIVHHINHNRLDNRPENLELAKNQKEHFNHHREVFERQKVIFKGKHFSPETEFKKKS